ncbi:hypothetical protein H8A95_32065 [Bradyrhizobium sp. Pear76]|uniref:hypothetical protein n=1 Tax=Bradyrhizobium oropedii TaxID=1571201 RepID=UPI001E3122D4|nr:hypothetical protein [Bradyrhizobium oropedii]MCC8966838.1 hypothetical protein [Bradyrhizobium oropedii]
MTRLLFGTAAAGVLLAAASTAHAGSTFSFVPDSLTESVIEHGPWTLHQSGRHFHHDASGIVPPGSLTPPYNPALYGTPYADYCSASGETTINHGKSVMQPYYFPFVRRRGAVLEGLFDYRPRNEQEATVAAISTDWGATWQFRGKALALNSYCPWDATDPDNLNVNVNGVKTAYGSSSANAGDNGLGHAFVLSVKGKQRIYHLNRADGHIDSDQLVVHPLHRGEEDFSLFGLPEFGYVSPLASGGYPKLEATVTATTGLTDPDAILGSVHVGEKTAVVYVSKNLTPGDKNFPATQVCPATPAFALTNLVNKKPRKTNHDVITIRVATTSDGVNFTDVGAATGLNDQTTIALNGIRWLGSGSILRIHDGRFGMFFGAGNCLDNDSDGFHFVGYAETDNPVRAAGDLLKWHVVNGFDSPILSTDTVVDPAGPRSYPLNAPLVNVQGADRLTAAQVAPFVPPGKGYTTNFFSGRVYDPQAVLTDERTVTIVFAGYNTPQPSSNLADYRSIGRFQLGVQAGYFRPPFVESED